MATHEIEIKSLLGTEENANNLKKKLKERGASLVSQHKQLNHYFILNDVAKLKTAVSNIIDSEQQDRFIEMLEKGSNFSVRTRDADGKVLFVIKASVDDTTSENGIRRMEFEEVVDMSLDELDNLLIENGCEYQAKWSRERDEYKLHDFNVCIDKNAGYGYLAEVERVVDGDEDLVNVQKTVLDLMSEFGLVELPQDRLGRMFAHYNEHWRDYYGTDKTFTIE